MPHTLECFRCHKAGLVRLETVVRAGHAVKHYHCGRCDYAWNEDSQPPADADRRKRVTQRRTTPRNERRKADA